jgi:uncharacterized protein YndB with AHSA1/START domain
MVITRVFNAPVEQVWKAWSDSEQVKRWWGPNGFTCPVANVDFHEGGVSLVCMRAPAEFGGQDMYNTWTYTTIVPMELIEFVHNFADKDGNKVAPSAHGLPPEIPFDVPHRLTFKAIGDHQTEFTVTEFGYPSEQLVEMSRAGMEQCLDKLAETFQ